MTKLYMIPFAGGSCYSYRPLEQLLDELVQPVTFELPGRGMRMDEPFLKTLNDAVEDIYHQIDTDKPDDFAIFGHSMGAILAYLITLKLVERGHSLPRHLFLSGHRAPVCKQRARMKHSLPKEEFIKELKKLDGVPIQLLNDPEAMDFFEPVIRADFRLIEGYCQADVVPVPVPIQIFMGEDDDITEFERHHWKDFTTKNFIQNEYKGGHFFIYQHKVQVTKTITKCLVQ